MTDLLFECLKTENLGSAIEEKEAVQLAKDVLEGVANLKVYPRSLAAANRTLYFLGRRDKAKLLGIISENPQSGEVFEGHQAKVSIKGKEVYLTVASTQPGNAALLRETLHFLKPQLLGTKKSAGCGDRLALATPGHIRAIRKSSLAPISLNSPSGKTSVPAGHRNKSWTTPCGGCFRRAGGKDTVPMPIT